MFIRKFLSRVVYMKPLEDEGSAGGFNMDSVMSDIADGLGFNLEEGGDGNDPGNDGADDPAGSGAGSVPADGAGGGEGTGTQTPAGDQPAVDAPPADPANPPASAAPRTWRPEAAAKFATLPADVQTEILKREEDMFKGIEGYKADATKGKAFDDAIQTFASHLGNTDPVGLTKELMAVHFVLQGGSAEQKQQLAQQLLTHYGVQLAPPADDSNPFIDPQVKALRDELAAVKSQLSGTAQTANAVAAARAQEVRAKLAADVDAFEKDPKNIHFADVAGLIPQILQSGLAKDLQSAYEHAVMVHPVAREKEIARRTAESSQKAAAEAAAKAEAARKAAGANVRTRAKQAGGTAPLGSIDDTLTDAYKRLMAKSE